MQRAAVLLVSASALMWVILGCQQGAPVRTDPRTGAVVKTTPTKATAKTTRPGGTPAVVGSSVSIQGPVYCGRCDEMIENTRVCCLVIRDEATNKLYLVSNAPEANMKVFRQRRRSDGGIVASADGKITEVNAAHRTLTATRLDQVFVEVKATPKIEPKVEPKVEPEPIAKIEPKVEPKVETKIEPKVEPKVETKVEPKVEVKTDPRPVPVGQVIVVGKSVCTRDDRGDTLEPFLGVVDQAEGTLYIVADGEKRYPALYIERFRKIDRTLRVTGKPEVRDGRTYLREALVEALDKPPAPLPEPKTKTKTKTKDETKSKDEIKAEPKTKAEPKAKEEPKTPSSVSALPPAGEFAMVEGPLVCTKCVLGATADCRPAVRQADQVYVLTGDKVTTAMRDAAQIGDKKVSAVGRLDPGVGRLKTLNAVSVKFLAE